MAINKIKAVLFDLDGTLLDTIGDLAAAMNRSLAALGLPEHSLPEYHHFVGEGVRTLVDKVLSPQRRDAATIEKLLALFSEDYAKNWAMTTTLYAGVEPLLSGLRERGLALAVLSNKPHRYMAQIEQHFFPDSGFTLFCGHKEGVARKPNPEGALLAAREMNLPPEQFLYVGDSCVDMQTALSAGMQACGALWGYRTEEELREHGAQILAHAPQEILYLL